MITSRFIVGVVFLFVSTLSFSDECASWGCISTISELYITTDGDIRVGTPLDEKLASCTPASGVFFTLNQNSANAKEVYSTLLAAYMSEKKIQLRTKDGSPDCELAYVRLQRDF